MVSNSEHMLWVERYRPQKVSECILPSATIASAQSFVDTGSIPNLILKGPAGTGKTTLAKALCRELGYTVMTINGSNEGRLIDTLRSKIMQFASTMSMEGTRKCVILDEADYIPADTVQPALRNFMEEFHTNCSFIMTCNFPNRIIDPLHSRCSSIDFSIPAEEKQDLFKQVFIRVAGILKENGVEYDKGAVAALIKRHFPDFRRILNELQRYSATGKIDEGILVNHIESGIDKLVEILREKNFKEMRQWVATTSELNMSNLGRALYNRMYDVCEPNSMPQLVLDIADFAFKEQFVADREINTAAFLTTVMMNVEFK